MRWIQFSESVRALWLVAYRYLLLVALAGLLWKACEMIMESHIFQDNWKAKVTAIILAASLGGLVSHVYDSERGIVTLPDMSRERISLGVFSEIILAIFAAAATIYILYSVTSLGEASTELSEFKLAGVSLLSGLAATSLIPKLRESAQRNLDGLRRDLEHTQQGALVRDLYFAANAASKQGHLDEAQDYYRRALDTEPNHHASLAGLSDVLLQKAAKIAGENPEDSRALIEEAVRYNARAEQFSQNDEQKANDLVQRAAIDLVLHDKENAAKALNDAIALFRKGRATSGSIESYILANEVIQNAKSRGEAVVVEALKNLEESRS
jgi:tetratricopeptide (TPR) repeat protein